MPGVWIGEQEIELVGAQLAANLRELCRDLLAQVGVAFRQLIQLDNVARTPLEPIPRRDQLAILGGLSRHLTRLSGVIPDPWLRELLV